MARSDRTRAARVPFRIRFFYGAGSLADGVKNTAFNTFLLFYYTNVLGLPGSLSGAALFVALCVDAVTDPLMGSISDNFRSRWGRRHPFMYAAALPMAGCFFGLFRVPEGLHGPALFAWLTAFAIGVRVCMTLYAIPSGALAPEITTDYDERTSLIAWRYLFGWIGALVIAQLGYLHFFAPSAEFGDGRLDPRAYAGFGAAGAVLIASGILACALGTHRLIPYLRRAQAGMGFTLRRFAKDVRSAISNPSYRALLAGSIFWSAAIGFNDVLGLYMNTYFWEFPTEKIGLLVYFMLGAMVIGFVGTRPLSERFDKRRAALGLATFAIFWGPLPILLRFAGVMPANGSALLLGLIAAHAMLLVAAAVAVGILLSSMILDAVDEHELDSGDRQEGVFVAAISFTSKAVSGFGNLIGGVTLDLIAFPRGALPGAVPADKITALGLAVGPGMMVIFAFALIFLARYRITRERHRQVLRDLAARRDAAALSPTAD